MATATDLMGLGLPAFLAARLSSTPTAFTASGASQASAAQIGPTQQIIYVNATNSGSGLKLPPVGGDRGCLNGDDFTILNLQGASLNVYAATAVQSIIYFKGASTAGTTGVGLDPGFQGLFLAITPSTWMCITSSA